MGIYVLFVLFLFQTLLCFLSILNLHSCPLQFITTKILAISWYFFKFFNRLLLKFNYKKL